MLNPPFWNPYKKRPAKSEFFRFLIGFCADWPTVNWYASVDVTFIIIALEIPDSTSGFCDNLVYYQAPPKTLVLLC